jgi:hypothetical protein
VILFLGSTVNMLLIRSMAAGDTPFQYLVGNEYLPLMICSCSDRGRYSAENGGQPLKLKMEIKPLHYYSVYLCLTFKV